ncbi:hypothetical protein BY458DRAFT_495068 [Sporodiniella umbellata]|nr:hypothetical protein BY458DRAFT_495068 [Sporodiniella umbellata]
MVIRGVFARSNSCFSSRKESLNRLLRKNPTIESRLKERCDQSFMWEKKNSVAKNARIVFSGIQPTGAPHLGNYLGALANWTKLQDPDPVTGANSIPYYSIVDLHAITIPQNPATLRQAKIDMATTLLACGVDPDRSVLFEQSRVRAHTELAWIFNCITPVGWLGRMTQWKSKMSQDPHALADSKLTAGLKVGLFDYPVLQAADILLYKGTHVPVGQDQMQHLELSRDIAQLFNKTFGNLFPKPNAIVPPATQRVMSLRNPESKMSKSDPTDASRINLMDSPSLIQAKIKKAVTDSLPGVSYDLKERPGMSNLVGIYATCKDIEVAQALEEFSHINSTREFKEAVSEAVIEKLAPIQDRLVRLKKDEGYVKQVLDKGAKQATQVADKTIAEVYKLVGLS